MLCLPRVSCTTSSDGSKVHFAAAPLRFSRWKKREEDVKRRRRRRRQRRLVGCGLACRLVRLWISRLVLGRSQREEGRNQPKRPAGLYVFRWAGPGRVPAGNQSINPHSPPRVLDLSLIRFRLRRRRRRRHSLFSWFIIFGEGEATGGRSKQLVWSRRRRAPPTAPLSLLVLQEIHPRLLRFLPSPYSRTLFTSW